MDKCWRLWGVSRPRRYAGTSETIQSRTMKSRSQFFTSKGRITFSLFKFIEHIALEENVFFFSGIRDKTNLIQITLQWQTRTNCPLTAQMYRKTGIQPVNKRGSRYVRKLHRNIRFLKIFFANLHFKVRGNRAYCGGHADKYSLFSRVFCVDLYL